MGKKKEDDEGVLFYLLLASVMHRDGRSYYCPKHHHVLKKKIGCQALWHDRLEGRGGRPVAQARPRREGGVAAPGRRRSRRKKSHARGAIGSHEGVRIFRHKEDQFANC